MTYEYNSDEQADDCLTLPSTVIPTRQKIRWRLLHDTSLSYILPPYKYLYTLPYKTPLGREKQFNAIKCLYHYLWVSGNKDQGYPKRNSEETPRKMDTSLNPNNFSRT